ncbi:hypothetical protein VTU32_00540 [Thermoanaerobacter sp. CM-CNRG TB177]|jgi:hypothetical protein|uniref:hypothetical protein n=1 Tax=Thermoanaerobacter sp. CM-CNRG TB177 TaxID=2800659 RepID=UPI001BDF0B5F|nr:hypothetical protein [Thermoanaerobacter sp. CM-CNRG TB177]MBT1279459.1 hypothetical protein [Thermoanaerobacter sp. CM-CNRG TB177]
MESLDQLCAEYGYKFAEQVSQRLGNPKTAETLITKALGVLQEQGLYAFILFCESRGNDEKHGAEEIKRLAKEVLKDKLQLISNGDILEEVRKKDGLASRLYDLMLAVQVLEKSLIYARFHAKAMKKAGEE